MNTDIHIKDEITNILLETPIVFYIGRRRFEIRPFTLGKWLIAERTIRQMKLDSSVDNITKEVVRLCLDDSRRQYAARLIAISTFYRRQDIISNSRVEKRSKWLLSNLDPEEMAQLLILILSSDNTTLLKSHLGISSDNAVKSKISNYRKRNGDFITVGGKSVWGSMIDFACERYGWTLQYVLWGLSYANLIMMTSDISASISLDKEERKSLHISTGDVIKADDPVNRAKIIQILQNN